jgi:ABC-type uncharacterized transport system permease subunit
VEGKVGIGTTSPHRPLTITNAGDASIALLDSQNGSQWELQAGAFIPDNFGIVRYEGGVAQGPKSVFVNSSGNVGLGAQPNKKLSVQGAIETAYEGIYFGGVFGFGGNDYNYGIGARLSNSLVYDSHEFHRWRVSAGTLVEVMTLNRSGNLQISGSLTQGSSRELKENIADLSAQEATETLQGLSPVRFNYTADEERAQHLGFIAEDVPDLVATPDKKGLRPMDIVAVLTKVVQEQQKTIAILEEKVNAMEESS